MQLRHLALGNGVDAHLLKAAQLVEGCDVLEVAGEAVEAFGQHQVERTCFDRVVQSLERRTFGGGAG